MTTPPITSGPRQDPLPAYRAMFEEMRAAAEGHTVVKGDVVMQPLNPRDPMADPDLARYLLPARLERCGKSSRCSFPDLIST